MSDETVEQGAPVEDTTPTAAAHKPPAAHVKPHITSISPVGDLTIIGVPPGKIDAKDFDSLPISAEELVKSGHWTANYSRGGSN